MPTPLMDDEKLRRIITAATAAPSIHNTQPWQFTLNSANVLEIRADPDRELWVADPRARALYLSCGAALFNARLAIRMLGYNPLVWPLPHPQTEPLLLAAVQAEPARPPCFAEQEAYQAIWRRHTNRRPFTGARIPDSVETEMEQAASFEFAALRMLEPRDAARVIDLASTAESMLAADPDHQLELQRWIGATSGADGIPASALAPRPDHRPAPVRELDLASAAPGAEHPVVTYEASPRLGVLLTTRDEPADWLRAGQALQRLLLVATVHGLQASFLYQVIELREMLGDAAPAWPWAENPQIVIRFGYGDRPTPSPRRAVDDVLLRRATTGYLPSA